MSSFVRDPTASLASEFSRLAISQGLSRGSDAYRNQRRRFYADAVTADFETHFGRNEASLEAWRDLLKTCGIRDEDIPSSITGCKKVSDLANSVNSVAVFWVIERSFAVTSATADLVLGI